MISDERGDLAVAVRDYATSRAEFERSIALQRAYLLEEPAAGLARRDLLWTTFASALSLKAAGDAAGQRLRLQEACALARDAALSEYGLFARDLESLADVAGQNGVRC